MPHPNILLALKQKHLQKISGIFFALGLVKRRDDLASATYFMVISLTLNIENQVSLFSLPHFPQPLN